MLRLLHGAGFIEDDASAVIRSMALATSRRALFLSDLDFYESRFGNITNELASFLLSKHGRTETEASIALFRRLLDRGARPKAEAEFTFGDGIVQCSVLHAIKAELAGFIANEEHWLQQFPDDWEGAA